ncbi:2a1ac150-5d9d-40fa-8266-dd9197317499 [Sclerotinia trifoliorum]|uniref:2a1ac150-5d9d-40fa-8266-dd9197317499 n=1 Tax=Sclerotinia trifoliorum TaxID=28548 RepID=A0A8H2W4V3_9HELO|nr:2a1ac150-5d9d-40fa-8266-dd9197317499 [Sclerotinia trifoliorum]
MSFPYKHVLLVGATSGIGLALAERLVKECKVTVVGRRRELLDDFVAKHGSNAQAATFDLSDLEKAPQFAADVMKANPDIDCVFLNAGFQQYEDWTKPEAVDIPGFRSTIDINFISFVILTKEFLPYLSAKKEKTSIIYTTSNLAIVPAVMMSSYSASKAALNAFILCLRDDLSNSSVNIVELLPPLVQTPIHSLSGPDGKQLGMPLDEFTEKAYAGLCSSEDSVYIGDDHLGEPILNVMTQRRAVFEGMATVVKSLR